MHHSKHHCEDRHRYAVKSNENAFFSREWTVEPATQLYSSPARAYKQTGRCYSGHYGSDRVRHYIMDSGIMPHTSEVT